MVIKIIGFGCEKYKAIVNIVKSVIAETKLDVQLEMITDFRAIMLTGIIATPAISIDGDVVCIDRVPDKKEVLNWIVENTIS